MDRFQTDLFGDPEPIEPNRRKRKGKNQNPSPSPSPSAKQQPGRRQLNERPIEGPGARPNYEGADEGMARASKRAGKERNEQALAVLRGICLRQAELTVDDLHAGMLEAGIESFPPKAFGSVWKAAARAGLAVATERQTPTRRPRAHGRKVPVYRSLIHQ